MKGLFDILLNPPIGFNSMRLLLFLLFSIHLTFVLLMIGTGIIAVFHFVQKTYATDEDSRWGNQLLRSFTGFKSLAVVFGVGPILLIQVGHSIPFLTSVNLLGSSWMLLTLIIMIAFLCLDLLSHQQWTGKHLQLGLGIGGLFLLIMVPAIFVAVLVVAENPNSWNDILHQTVAFPARQWVHWLFRYFHILGASLIVAAAYHMLVRTTDPPEFKEKFRFWIVIGLTFQMADGVALYLSLPNGSTRTADLLVGFGATTASLLLLRLFFSAARQTELPRWSGLFLTLVLLVFMLGTRQFLQDKVLIPLHDTLAKNAVEYRKNLKPYEVKALQLYHHDIHSPQKGTTNAYLTSCAFCHGVAADGKGPDAPLLKIQPKDLTAMRAKEQELKRILLEGIPGSGMPRFNYYLAHEIDDLIGFLDENLGILQPLPDLPKGAPMASEQRTTEAYQNECARCHGETGKPSAAALKKFLPAPLDFGQVALLPQKSYEQITLGVSGTEMPAFKHLPEPERWGLVRRLMQFYSSGGR